MDIWGRGAEIGAAVMTYLAGETGRMLVAGAAGGLVRWVGQERRRLRDGVLAVITGALAAVYLSPVVLAVLAVLQLDLGDTPQAYGAAGFIAGLGGMSIARLVLALMETWAARQTRQGGGDAQ